MGRKKTTKKAAPQAPPIATKTVQNISLQAWPVDVGEGATINLTPGNSIKIPAAAVTDRLINLHKRRLISIS
tara:strand:- start:302 stop:517 length:216 start_codon:yes stop_codon:yes gene_type:complete